VILNSPWPVPILSLTGNGATHRPVGGQGLADLREMVREMS